MKALVHHRASLQAKNTKTIDQNHRTIHMQTRQSISKTNQISSSTLNSQHAINKLNSSSKFISRTSTRVYYRTFATTIPPFPLIHREPAFLDLPSSSPELVILGSGAGEPTNHRMCSNYALRLGNGETFLFDCGESCHIQLKKSNVKMSSISRVFITHLHGDHFFGLLGLTLSITKARGDFPLSVYGPVGLRKFFRNYTNMAKLWGSHTMPTVFIHELHTSSFQHLHDDLAEQAGCGEHDIRVAPSDSIVFQEPNVTVRCALMEHLSVPCFGYVVHEKDIPGTVQIDKIKSLGLQPGAWIRSLKSGTVSKIVLPDGKAIAASELMSEPRKGKKIVILGDTCNSDLIGPTAEGCDSVVHECTLRESDIKKAKTRGHSTPSMAAKFAANIKAKQLILSHFGQTDTIDSAAAEAEAAEIGQRYFHGDILIAKDLMRVEIKREPAERNSKEDSQDNNK